MYLRNYWSLTAIKVNKLNSWMERRFINLYCVAYCILDIDLGSENLAISYFDESFFTTKLKKNLYAVKMFSSCHLNLFRLCYYYCYNNVNIVILSNKCSGWVSRSIYRSSSTVTIHQEGYVLVSKLLTYFCFTLR